MVNENVLVLDPATVPVAGDEGPPRVCIFSLRDIESHVSRACGYEFEDTIYSELDSVDIIRPQHAGLSRHRLAMHRWLSRNFSFAEKLPSGLEVHALTRPYDLFFFSAAQPRDLSALASLKNWRERSKYAVCFLQELWLDDLDPQGFQLQMLNQFDHVICAFADTVPELQRRLNVPVSYAPWSIDAVLFCPMPKPPRRAIDLNCVGAIPPETHRPLIEYAERTGKLYLYDTIGGRAQMTSHRAHRRNYANMLKRTDVYFAWVAKAAFMKERGSQKEFGLRYLEAVAAGALVFGDVLDTPAFKENLGWEDSVFSLPYGTDNPVEIIEAAKADPDRLAAARQRNVVEGLSRHDHFYLWRRILRIAGLAETSKMAKRERALQSLIRKAQDAPHAVFEADAQALGV